MTYIFLLTSLFACNEKEEETGMPESEENEPEAMAPSTEPEEQTPTGSIQGQFQWSDGTPAPSILVQFCASSCYMAVTDEEGLFEFSNVPAQHYTLQGWVSDDPTYSTPTAPVSIEEDTLTELSPWIIPPFTTQQNLSEASNYTLEDGLSINIDPSTFSKGPYSISEAHILSGVQIDPTQSGIPFDEIEGTVLALWHLGTYDLQFGSAGELGGTLNVPIEEGTELIIYTVSNSEKRWREDGRVLIGANQSITMLEGALSQLTTLIFVQP